MKSTSKLLYAALLFLGACSKSDSPDPEPVPAVTLTLVQKETKISDATVKLIYDDNGQPKTLSAVTDASGKITLNAPLNRQMQMTITSKCGILLYDWKAGPFTETKKMDTVLAVNAYSPDCETSAPDQYITTNTFGVISRWTSFDSKFSFWITNSDKVTYAATRNDKSEELFLEKNLNGFGAHMLGIWTNIGYYYSGTNTCTYTEKGDYGEYMAGSYTSYDDNVYGGKYDEFPHEKITGTFRLKRRHYKEDPNWPMLFPE